MSHELRNSAKEPVPPLFEPAFHDMEDYDPMNIGGPGGQTINSENNEKGILESGLQRVINHNPKTADLQATHPRVGIYGSDNTN
jgi:hypothetical protein